MCATLHDRIPTPTSQAHTICVIKSPWFMHNRRITESVLSRKLLNGDLNICRRTAMMKEQVVSILKGYTSRYYIFLDLIRCHQIHRFSTYNEWFEILRTIEKSCTCIIIIGQARSCTNSRISVASSHFRCWYEEAEILKNLLFRLFLRWFDGYCVDIQHEIRLVWHSIWCWMIFLGDWVTFSAL